MFEKNNPVMSYVHKLGHMFMLNYCHVDGRSFLRDLSTHHLDRLV